MAATSSDPSPNLSTRVELKQSELHPGWHENIYVARFEIENLENIRPGLMTHSEVVKVGSDGFKLGVKITDTADQDRIGVFLYKVIVFVIWWLDFVSSFMVCILTHSRCPGLAWWRCMGHYIF